MEQLFEKEHLEDLEVDSNIILKEMGVKDLD
jgi:hypothetical protein